jgi:preprotein translocase subunit SecD
MLHLSSPAKKVVLIFLLTIFCLLISLPAKVPLKINLGPIKIDKEFIKPTKIIRLGPIQLKTNYDLALGLDLAGGSHLVFEADTTGISSSDRKDALDSAKSIIEQRVNFLGVSEPNILVSSFAGKDRLIVELPGIKDSKTAIDLIGTTAQLDFREYINDDEATKAANLRNTKATGFTGKDFKKATAAFDKQNAKPIISFEIKSESANKFGEITTRLVGKPLVTFLDNLVLSRAIVSEPIREGRGQITGSFTIDETKLLAKLMNAGALPVPIKLVEERTVGATLGVESVDKSVKAGLVGLSIVLLFMMINYGKLGFVADIGLIIFGIITLALYKLIPVVLTLPGIAGFLLSVGMAVDSNILIFERFKEEKVRREIADALEISFGRAWDSIRDANIATLITCFILANPFDWSFLHTSGPVRGFAITLALGIGISLFTGIVVSRNLLRLFIRESKRVKE